MRQRTVAAGSLFQERPCATLAGRQIFAIFPHGWRVANLHRRIDVTVQPSAVGSVVPDGTDRTIGMSRAYRCYAFAAISCSRFCLPC